MDIVERLREHNEPPFDYIAHRAASEIERLRKDYNRVFKVLGWCTKDRVRLRNALYRIASMEHDPDFGNLPISEAQKIAQNALDDG